jgi:SAM-dependent methyltransferase
MSGSYRFKGTLDFIYARWPRYLLAYAGLMLSLALIGIGAARGWLALLPLGAVMFIMIGYFLGASIWLAYQLYDYDGLQHHHVLFDMGQIQDTERFVYIHLGLRHRAVELGQRLTSGRIVVVDTYSPQWAPNRYHARWRNRMKPAFTDPRFEWCNGDLGLLPLPDRSVQAVILCQVLSELWQQGDQLRLLKEAWRVLVPDGRLLISESARTQTHWLLMGPAALGIPTVETWRTLLMQAGFRERQVHELRGIIHCFRADKPTLTEAKQLALELAIP